MGKHCVFVIQQYKGKCDSLKIILLIFYLSCCVTLDPHIIDCLHIYNKFVVLTIDKPRLFTVVFLFHHIFCQQYGQTLRLCHLPKKRKVQFTDNHTTHRHRHVWMRCFETTNIMISCMSLISIHMYYFCFIIILWYYSRSSESLLFSRNLLIVSAFGTVS